MGEPINIEKNETSLTCIIYPGFEIIVSHQILADDELILLEGYFLPSDTLTDCELHVKGKTITSL